MSTSPGIVGSGPAVPKRIHACDFCRAKKIRCIGDRPCSNCVEIETECVFTPRQRRKRKGDGQLAGKRASQLDRCQVLLGAAGSLSANTSPLPDILDAQPSHSRQEDHADQLGQLGYVPNAGHSSLLADIRQTSHPALEGGQRREAAVETFDSTQAAGGYLPRSRIPPTVTKLPMQFVSDEAPWERCKSPDKSTTIGSPQDTGGYHTFKTDVEFWGPRTSMSICSLAGISWVTERAKQPEFRATANRFTQDVARRLKLEKRLTRERKEDPGLKAALRYTRAYFEEASGAALGIVRRSCFESRLRSFYMGSTDDDDDPSWYAMRNVVFASGCRIVLSKETTYTKAQEESWSYFENALSVHSELLCFRTSVMGVQSLTLMVQFRSSVRFQ